MNGLQNYWPIGNNDVNDIVSGANMYDGYNVAFTNDRFNNPNSALDLNYGYYSLPAREYVCGDFTFSIWAYIRNTTANWNRFLDIGNGINLDFIVIYYSSTVNYPGFYTFDQNGLIAYTTTSSIPIAYNRWDHYAFTLSGTNAKIYINGILVANTVNVANCLYTTSNYIGKSNMLGVDYANAVYDDIRLYNRALDVNEIQNLMKL